MAPNKDFPLHFVYDLGYRDDTATICFQDAVDGYPIYHAEADNLRPIRHYIERIHAICSHYDCPRGRIWLPHDAKAKSLQTGRSIVEQFLSAGIRPSLVPTLDVLDGIQAARMLFPDIYFNANLSNNSGPCYDLVEALKTYRREWDEDKKAFKNKPVEDWSVHYADTFRYFALVAQRTSVPRGATREGDVDGDIGGDGANYAFSLEDLYENQLGNRTRFL